jgi:hypothetical protein
MSFNVSGSQVSRMLAALIGSALLIGAIPVVADAACPTSPTVSSFAQFGDGAAYSLAPGGSFESPNAGWSFSNASVINGNESFNLVAGSHSLAIGPNGVAVSPWICISSEYPSFRFFARQLSGATNASLGASLQWITLLGLSVDTAAGSVRGGSSWAPSPVMKLGSSVPLWLPGSTLYVRLSFRPAADSAWAIDDVFIDPYRR